MNLQHLKYAICLLAAWCLIPAADAQNIYSGNPADMDALESTFSNPALNAYARDRLALALTSHQTGVAGKLFSIRSGIITYHLPWTMRGTAVGIQYLKAGLYSQNDFRISYGQRIYGPIAVGANLDVFNRSFDDSEFYMFDPEDPVFRNGYSKGGMSLGLGMAVIPYRAIVFGFSAEHLNRPDLAMGGGYIPQPIVMSTGFKMYFDNFNIFSSINALEYLDYNDIGISSTQDMLRERLQFGVEIPFYGYGALRFATGARALRMELEAFIYKSLYFNYRYEYPLTDIDLASSGTHRFGLLFDFWRQPPLPDLLPLPEPPKYRAEVAPKSTPPKGQFFVYSNSDSVNVYTRRVHRSIDNSVPHYSLGLLFAEDLGDIGGLYSKTPTHRLSELEVRDPTVLPKEVYSTKYRGALEGIGFTMLRSDIATEMVTYPGAERRGNALANQITGNFTAVSKKIPIYAPDSLQLMPEKVEGLMGEDELQQLIRPETAEVVLVPIFKANFQGNWWMEVRTSKDSTIFSYSGVGEPPDTVRWDWKAQSGGYVPPGIFYFIFKSEDENGNPEFSARHYFKVYHIHSTLNIAITRESRVGDIDADKYILILGGKSKASQTQHGNNPQKDDKINNQPNKEDLDD